MSASPLNAKSPQNVGVRQLSGPRMSAHTHTHTHTHTPHTVQCLIFRLLPFFNDFHNPQPKY